MQLNRIKCELLVTGHILLRLLVQSPFNSFKRLLANVFRTSFKHATLGNMYGADKF